VLANLDRVRQKFGYLEKGHLVRALRDDPVGEFIGHTAPKTRCVLDRVMGGVLFIDEAYYLYRSSDSKDYGQECADILLKVMEGWPRQARGHPRGLHRPHGQILCV
jgi:hypothetical protein